MLELNRSATVSYRVSDTVTGTSQACSASLGCWGRQACGIIIQLCHTPASADCGVKLGHSHYTAAGAVVSPLWRLPSCPHGLVVHPGQRSQRSAASTATTQVHVRPSMARVYSASHVSSLAAARLSPL